MNGEYFDFDFDYISNYISENYFGLFLLVFAFLIIYFVDRINQINAAISIMSNSTPVLGITNTLPINLTNNIKKKSRSHKNHSR